MSRTRQKSLFIMPEGNYAADPDSDGSGYEGVPCEALTDPTEGKVPLAADYADGSNYPGDPIEGFDGGEISFNTPCGGLTADQADPVNVALDWWDHLLMHLTGTRVNLVESALSGNEAAGQTVISVASGATRVTGDPVAFTEPGVARAQWSRVQSVAVNDLTCKTPLEYALTAAGGAKSKGVRAYRDLLGGGPTFALVHVQVQGGGEIIRTLLGCRVTKCRVPISPRAKTMWEWTVRYDSVVFGGKASLPDPVQAPAFTPIKGPLSPVHVDGVSLGHVGQVVIDFAPEALEIPSVHGTAAGRGGDEIGRLIPTVVVNPVNAQAYYEDVRAADKDLQVTVQLGSGSMSAGIVNSMAIMFDRMGPVAAAPEDQNNLRRVKLTYTARNPGLATGARFVQICRV